MRRWGSPYSYAPLRRPPVQGMPGGRGGGGKRRESRFNSAPVPQGRASQPGLQTLASLKLQMCVGLREEVGEEKGSE